MSEPSTIFISAGEASGEHYGALLVEELKRQLKANGQSADSLEWAARAWSMPASSA